MGQTRSCYKHLNSLVICIQLPAYSPKLSTFLKSPLPSRSLQYRILMQPSQCVSQQGFPNFKLFPINQSGKHHHSFNKRQKKCHKLSENITWTHHTALWNFWFTGRCVPDHNEKCTSVRPKKKKEYKSESKPSPSRVSPGRSTHSYS